MDCGATPRISYGDFSSALHAKAWSGPTIPVNGTIEITSRCNLRCVHCYVPEHDRLPSCQSSGERSPLTKDEILHVIDEITDAGCLWLLMTGGEPLSHPNFLDVYLHAKRKGLLITVFSNGTLVTERIADVLADYRPFRVEITLYGATAATYEAVTGIPGSFERCMRGVELLLERRVPIALKTVVLRNNVHELGRMQTFAAERSVPFRWDSRISPRLDGDLGPAAQRLTPEEMVALELADPARMQAWRQTLEQTRHIRLGRRLYSCWAGIGNFHIDAYGILRPCGFVRRHEYDLRNGTFDDGYRQNLAQVLSAEHASDSICQQCDLTGICRTCPAWLDLESEGQNEPVEYICRFAQILASTLTDDVGSPSRESQKEVIG